MKKYLPFFLVSLFGGIVAIASLKLTGNLPSHRTKSDEKFANIVSSRFTSSGNAPQDFIIPSEKALPAVVHIQNKQKNPGLAFNPNSDFFDQMPEQFRQFFDIPRSGPQRRNQEKNNEEMVVGTGSGVIISMDGYIATNNHVIKDADKLEVTLNDGRKYDAQVLGSDPSTDIALIKVNANNLPTLSFANSDEIKVGSWCLAVGNPFNLNSTVTAGIISAKGRNINILQDKAPIESFIQTDAAINPGNSGGALVNLEGQLIGINTAIASQTGSYSGYGFAVPSNIVSKVVKDLKDFGTVQRGYLGAMIRSVDANLISDKKLKVSEGVYVDSLTKNSSALAAGIRSGDVILKVNGIPTPTSAILLEMIGRQRPGDDVTLSINRFGVEKDIHVILRNSAGNTQVVKKEDISPEASKMGLTLIKPSKDDLSDLGLDHGLQIHSIEDPMLKTQGLRPGFIITSIDGYAIRSVRDVEEAVSNKKGGVLVEGKYPGDEETYFYGIKLRK